MHSLPILTCSALCLRCSGATQTGKGTSVVIPRNVSDLPSSHTHRATENGYGAVGEKSNLISKTLKTQSRIMQLHPRFVFLPSSYSPLVFSRIFLHSRAVLRSAMPCEGIPRWFVFP